MKVVWTEPAETDLDELYDYIARDAPIYAEQYIDRILESVAKLTDIPRVGRKVPEADSDDVRELIVESQRVIYGIDEDNDTMHILALVHVRRNLAGEDDPPWR